MGMKSCPYPTHRPACLNPAGRCTHSVHSPENRCRLRAAKSPAVPWTYWSGRSPALPFVRRSSVLVRRFFVQAAFLTGFMQNMASNLRVASGPKAVVLPRLRVLQLLCFRLRPAIEPILDPKAGSAAVARAADATVKACFNLKLFWSNCSRAFPPSGL